MRAPHWLLTEPRARLGLPRTGALVHCQRQRGVSKAMDSPEGVPSVPSPRVPKEAGSWRQSQEAQIKINLTVAKSPSLSFG